MIVEDLRPLAVPVDNLVPDPENARKGDVAKVKRSLTVFGQRKPIVARRTGTDPQGRGVGIVEAGNHTLAAALELGWTEIAAVFVDDDQQMAKAFGLADNRTGDVATWDYEQLSAHLEDLQSTEFPDLDALGWDAGELSNLLNSQWNPDGDGDDTPLDEFSRDDKRAGGLQLSLSPDAAVYVKEAMQLAREHEGDLNLSEEAALVLVCKQYAKDHPLPAS